MYSHTRSDVAGGAGGPGPRVAPSGSDKFY